MKVENFNTENLANSLSNVMKEAREKYESCVKSFIENELSLKIGCECDIVYDHKFEMSRFIQSEFKLDASAYSRMYNYMIVCPNTPAGQRLSTEE